MMKKIILMLLAIFPYYVSAQDIFVDTANNKYLFLGGVHENKIKLLNLNDNEIFWKNRKELEQIDMMSASIFSEKIFDSGIVFSSGGDEPYWNAIISKNELKISSSVKNPDEKQIVIIKNDINQYSLDTSFVMMFQSSDHKIYGLIRGLSYIHDSPCDLDLDEERTTFEVFVNYEGNILKGCARLQKQ